uniref:YlmG homolog protein 2, chloroplastic n=1 Tax=Nelumbo nucifera TaxID=4432 RepID=A0A822ZI09_NELNU|nr:TPA_asm: hypothetical protein HUJ06_002493 [Nelumbo nucifera]
MASSSSSNEVEIREANYEAKMVSNFLLASTFPQTPFSPPRVRHLKPNLVSTPPDIIQVLHSSLLSSADRCFKTLNTIISANPFLQNLFSLPTNFCNFFQIHCRNSRSLNTLYNHNFAAILPGDSVAGIVVSNGILNFLNIYNTLLIVRLVLTWFPNTPPAIVSPLSTLCDPYLNIFRGIIPPLGGTLDLSPILAFLVLNAFTSTAAALPAELPITGASEVGQSSSKSRFFSPTTAQRKWLRRVYGNGSKNSGGS